MCLHCSTTSLLLHNISTAPHYIFTAPHYIFTAPHYIFTAPHYIFTAPQYIQCNTTSSFLLKKTLFLNTLLSDLQLLVAVWTVGLSHFWSVLCAARANLKQCITAHRCLIYVIVLCNIFRYFCQLPTVCQNG